MEQNTFAQNLAALRKEKGLTQEDLADLLNVSRQSVSKWESGKGYPNMERMIFLADYYGVSLDDLAHRAVSGRKETRYQARSFSETVDAFLNNLSPKQKTVFYILVFLVLLLAFSMIVFGLGRLFGNFLYRITH
jgi:transcriptional regulator with XRE-family HTH domain